MSVTSFTPTMENYIIKPAPYSFSCPIYGDIVKQGEDCVEDEGALFCVKVLEERNLVPLKAPSPSRNFKKIFGPGTVRWENLMMRIELETLAIDPDGVAAKKILDKYRRKIKAREERYLSSQN